MANRKVLQVGYAVHHWLHVGGDWGVHDADKKGKDTDQQTVLHPAAKERQSEMIKILLAGRAQIGNYHPKHTACGS